MKFIAEDDTLTIKLEGWEVFFGLKRELVIPRGSITSLEWHEDFIFDKKIWRTFGSGIVGVLYAGHFRGGGVRYFLYVRRPLGITWLNGNFRAQNVLLITTQDYAYKQIILTSDEAIAAGLINWWRGISSPT